MNERRLETFAVNGIRMRVALQGEGPLVLLCHGFPESWRSWRAQLDALAAAGFRAAAPDMRGYGGTDAPADPAKYTMLHHVGDLTELVRALGEKEAVVVGHDWGAPVAWHAALLRPEIFRAVVGMSVPYAPPGPVDLLTALEKQGITRFYMQYFQAEGVAEAELEADVERTMRRAAYSLSGQGKGGVAAVVPEGKGFLDQGEDPPTWPAWLDPEDHAYVVAEFERTGFRGGLNWYRAIRLSHELLMPWRGAPIRQPSLFIGGAADDVIKFANSRPSIERFATTLPGLVGSHILEGVGHWIQRERPAEVNALLLDFLRSLPA